MEQYDLLDMNLNIGNHEVKEYYLQMLKSYDEYIKNSIDWNFSFFKLVVYNFLHYLKTLNK